jgi:hypothetical protein
MAKGAMAYGSQVDAAAKHDDRMRQKAIKIEVTEEIYIQYERDREQREKQRADTLEVIKYYRETDLIPTNRRLIPDDTDMHLLIEALGLEDID